MYNSFYQQLKEFIWPKYHEEGPPKYMDMLFFRKGLIDNEGRIKEPVKSIFDWIVLGYRPVTSIAVLAILVENQNKPMYGTQIGAELERKFQLPEGWFTKTRYYDSRVAKLLKIFCKLDILEQTEVKDLKSKRKYVGYRIVERIYPIVKTRILNYLQGESLSILAPSSSFIIRQEEVESIQQCPSCNAIIKSQSAKYCELCGSALSINCPNCERKMSLEYSFCLYCGKKII
jgi:hypothetical protein